MCIMASFSLLLSLLCLTVYHLQWCKAQGPEGCAALISPDNLVRVLSQVPSLQPGDGNPLNLVIQDVYVNCLAPGSIRGYYREATYTLRFSGLPANPNQVRVGRLNVQCDPLDTRFWRNNIDIPFSSVPDEQAAALLNNDTTQTDCLFCNDPNHIRNPLRSPNDDRVRHCFRCPDGCLTRNLTLCYNDPNTGAQCCNVYVRESNNVLRCAEECPSNYSASSDTDYVCECSLPCVNGGTPNSNCSECVCPPGTMGVFCQDANNPCDPNPCRNGGTCESDSFTNYTCLCPPGFTGIDCSTELDPCESMPCSNGGTCEVTTYPDFTCTCPPNFTGPTCDIDICSGVTCLNGGVCEVVDGRGVCRCPVNHVGERCQNCTLPYCRNCSTETAGQCLACIPGFKIANGECVPDCNRCQDIADQDVRNYCDYFCLLIVWANASRRCELDIAPINVPSITNLEPVELYNRTVAAARIVENAWTSGAVSTINEIVAPMRPNQSFPVWRNATIQSVENLKTWVRYIRSVDSTFTDYSQQLDNALVGINDDDRAQEVHDRIRAVWQEIFNEFDARTRCSN